MKNGIYEATFTTSQGTLGNAAVMIKGRSFVGADGVHFYRGEIDSTPEETRVIMEVTRHNFAFDSAFGSQAIFTLDWRGEAIGDAAFKLGCQPDGLDITIYVTGRLLKELG